MHIFKLSTSLLIIAFSISCSTAYLLQNRFPSQPFVLCNAMSEALHSYQQPYPQLYHRASANIMNASASVWVDIGNHLNLNDKINSKRVKTELKKILADKSELNKSLKASAPYIYYIYTQIKARHLPAELALIPIIESDYNPYDHNSVGANGLWQLMPGTARILGVKIKDGYDGRRNVIESTKAALDYFTDLAKIFKNNWYLAIAAYNAGEGGVSKAMRKAKSNDYWQLPLPLETKLYVPRLLAIAEIIKHPKEYGVELPEIQNEPFFTTVEINKSTTLTDYAKSTGIDLKTLQELNPEYKTTKVMTHISNILLVPIDTEVHVAKI